MLGTKPSSIQLLDKFPKKFNIVSVSETFKKGWKIRIELLPIILESCSVFKIFMSRYLVFFVKERTLRYLQGGIKILEKILAH